MMQTAEQAAIVLLGAGVDRLPVRLRPIANSCNAGLFTYRQYAEAADIPLSAVAERFGNDGFTQHVRRRYMIFYREGGPMQRIRFTIAHELAHVLLGHMEQGAVPCSDSDRMADCLAAELLCPTAVLAACNPRDCGQLARLCDISQTAAQYRMGELRRRVAVAGEATTQPQQELLDSFKGYLAERREYPDEQLPRLRSNRI